MQGNQQQLLPLQTLTQAATSWLDLSFEVKWGKYRFQTKEYNQKLSGTRSVTHTGELMTYVGLGL